MAQTTEAGGPATPGKWPRVLGYLLSALPAAGLVMSAFMKLTRNPQLVEGAPHLGWPVEVLVALGFVELGCTVIYLVPRTAVLGAVLLTGYMGGAVATHVRIGEPFVAQVLFGVALWLGLWLREPRLKALLPLR
jgi:hypothetical protein